MKMNSINRRMIFLSIFCLIALSNCLFMSGCLSSSDGTGEDGDFESTDGDSDGDSEEQVDGDADSNGEEPDGDQQDEEENLIGAFIVSMIPPAAATEDEEATAGYTSFYGKVYDDFTPVQIIWEEDTAEGSCRLMKPRVPYCSTPCEGGAVCIEDGVCKAYPTSRNIGTVHVKGIMNNSSENEFDLEPISNGYQTTDLPYPAFAEGDAISVSASGSDFTDAFSLETKGIAPFELDNESIAVSDSQPINLTWTAPGQSGISSIYVKLDISHHGGSKGKIECDAEDNGSLEIPATLISELLGLGVAGFPTIVVARQSVIDTMISAGRVEMTISSSVEQAVEIAGLVSCNSYDDCTDGQTCSDSLMCE